MKFIIFVLAVLGGIFSALNMDVYHWYETTLPGHTYLNAYFLGAVVLAVYVGVACLAPKELPNKAFAIYSGIGNAFLCILGPLLSLMPHAREMDGLFTQLLIALISIPIKILQIPVGIVFPFLLGFGIVMVLPYFILALYTIFMPSRTIELAEKHSRTKTPSDDIERQIAEAIESGLSTDEQIKHMIDDLPAFIRVKHTFTYKQRAKKYRKMRELIEAQTEALNEKNKLAQAAHELERKKRGNYD